MCVRACMCVRVDVFVCVCGDFRSPNPTGGPRPQAGVSRSGSAPRIHTNALGIVRKSLLGPGNARERKERAKSDQPQGGWASSKPHPQS